MKSTESEQLSTRRYVWGIGLALSSVLLAIVTSWIFEGKASVTTYRRENGPETVHELRKEEAPIRFWAIIGLVGGAATISTVVTGRGLLKVWREEKKG